LFEKVLTALQIFPALTPLDPTFSAKLGINPKLHITKLGTIRKLVTPFMLS
jgi:hypothetical protein